MDVNEPPLPKIAKTDKCPSLPKGLNKLNNAIPALSHPIPLSLPYG